MPNPHDDARAHQPGRPRSTRRLATLLAAGLAVLVAGTNAAGQCVRAGSVPEPTKIVDVPPIYPTIARSAGVEGIVILEAVVDTGGHVASVKVLRSIPLLDAAAVTAAQQWRFAPPAQCVTTTLVVHFTLPAPGASPSSLQATVAGNTISLTWLPPASGAPDSYLLDAGSAAGLSDLASVPLPGTQTSLTAPAPDGVYYLRVRAIAQGVTSQPSNEVTAVIGCSGPPAAPTFNATQGPGGTPIHFAWSPPSGSITGYRLEAGTASGLADLAVVPVGATATALAAPAPPGTYYVRIRAVNACGQSPPSQELVVVVGGPTCVPPGAPQNLAASVNGTMVSLTWSPPATGTAPIGYTLLAGTTPGTANLGSFPLGSATSFQTPVPFGTYYVRVVASNQCGTSLPSNEAAVVVAATAPRLTFTFTPNPVPLTGVFAGCGGSTVPLKTWVYNARITNDGTAPFTIASWVSRVTSPLLPTPVDVPADAAAFAQVFGTMTIPPQGTVQSPLCVTGQFDGATVDWRFVDVQGATFFAPRIHILPAGF